MPNRREAPPPFKVNPFMPDSPVSPELFVGKSSLATYAEDLALNADKVFEKPQARFLTVFVSICDKAFWGRPR